MNFKVKKLVAFTKRYLVPFNSLFKLIFKNPCKIYRIGIIQKYERLYTMAICLHLLSKKPDVSNRKTLNAL